MRTWPVMNTTGTESIIASQIGVTRFVAPGPLVPSETPTLPVALRVALGGVAAAGLVAHEDVADAGVDERVVGREVRAAGEPEYDVDTLCLQALHHGVDRSSCARPPLHEESRDTEQRAARPGGSGAECTGCSTGDSGYSSSLPQRVHSASWTLQHLPQFGHWRSGSSIS